MLYILTVNSKLDVKKVVVTEDEVKMAADELYREPEANVYITTEPTVKLNKFYLFIKRAFDLCAALVVTAILLLPMAVISLIICLESKGKPIYSQIRMGRHGKPFTFYKFRSMYLDAPVCATRDLEDANQYITKVGAFLRITSLDELPQLINIIKGDMSFIGPRPVILAETELINKRRACGVYDVRPGITGYAQVNGRDFVSIDSKVEYDSFYAHNASVLFDVKLFFKTVKCVLKSDGIHEGTIDDSSNDITKEEKETVGTGR